MKRFVAALGEQLSLTSEEIADIIWLAVQMGEQPQPVTSESSGSLDTGKSRSPQQIEPPLPKDPIDLPNPESSPPPAEIHIPERSNLVGGLTISVPDARSLREPLELARSLKPLLQRVASGWSNVLDEEATILKLDRDRVWMPVLKPNLEAWLDLVLVVDESVSMQIWQRTISDLQRFLAHYGVFRDVRVYSLVVENERAYVRPRLGAASQGQSLRNPQELIDPSGRRLILVATDCVSAFWRSGEVLAALKLWAKSGPMAIVQMLPEWLWGRSGLGLASAVRFAALQAGIPNHQLKATNLSLWDDVDLDVGIKVPVVTLEPAPMKTWAQLVAGKGGIQSPGFVFDPEPLSTAGEEGSRTEGLFAGAGSGEERVRRFQVTASPMARQLAMILAAAPTISLPIVRILQDRLLPRSQQVHVAEVFLGGLLKPLVAVDPQSNPDSVPYEFMDGARDVLLDSVPTTEVVNVMQEVSQFVAERLGLTVDAFMGVLRNPQEAGDLDVVSQSRPFALMAAQILRKLGGDYAQLAQELEQANRQDPSEMDSTIDRVEDNIISIIFKTISSEVIISSTLNHRKVKLKNKSIDRKEIVKLLSVLRISRNDSEINAALKDLAKLAIGDEPTIQAIIFLLRITRNDLVFTNAVKTLGEITPVGNLQVIQLMTRWLNTKRNDLVRIAIIKCLANIANDDDTVVAAMVRLLKIKQSSRATQELVKSLGKIANGKRNAIDELIKKMKINNCDISMLEAVLVSLSNIAKGDSKAIMAMSGLLSGDRNESVKIGAAKGLGKIADGDPKAIRALVRIVTFDRSEPLIINAVESLGKIANGNPEAIQRLINILTFKKSEPLILSAAESLGKIAKKREDVRTAMERWLRVNRNSPITVGVAKSLNRIDRGNKVAALYLK